MQTTGINMTTAFVTGATGLLGANLVHTLVERGWTVRALVRSKDKAETQFGDLDVEVVEGDMARVSDFAEKLIGADVLFHTAAYFRDSYKGGSHWEKLYQINVTGTEDLMEAAWDSGVRRMVHISSTATVLPPPGRAGNEDDRRDTSDAHDDYFRSKVMSDLSVEAFMKQHPKFEVSFVLPGFMQGPRDLGPTSAGQMLLDFAHKRVPAVIDVQMSFVDARDVAVGVVLAAERASRGAAT
ncbi:MAG: dihydroflavonol-4-reductase [Myxococcota bacterium]|jgi:dihydroflavonol-4-reductase